MNRKAYPTDLKDAEWEILELLLPKAKPGGRPRSVDLREFLNAIFYRERTGCAWEMLPHDLLPAKTVYDYFNKVSADGTWERINASLVRQISQAVRRDSEPSAAIIDSQSVKTTEKGECGFDAAKQVKGRKRHLLVDVLGLVRK
jgi:putative transposase